MFDFDPTKSVANQAKHGIDFAEAQALWLDRDRVEVVSMQSNHSEERRLVTGKIGDRCWVAIVTQRGGVTRIISVRRARDYEEAAYDQARASRD